MAAVQFVGFAPDGDPSTPGIITDCEMSLPTVRGYKGAPSAVSTSLPALAAACVGAAYVSLLDGSYRFFAGSRTELYESATTAWTTRSAATYTGSAEGRWRFAQFGNTTYATNKIDAMQSSSSGNFAAVTGPKASIVEVVAGFVFAADTNEATYGDQSDRWWCSAFNDGTDWVPSTTTQSTTGRLIDTPGALTAFRQLGSDVVAYKRRGMWIGRYVGSPTVWEFTLISSVIGSPSQESVVPVDSLHYFVGDNNIYRFDGSQPVPIADAIKTWFFGDLNSKFKYKITGYHDKANSLIYFYYPSTASSNGVLDSAIVYNYVSGKWGRANRNIETVVDFLTQVVAYDNFGDYFSTYADIPSISYDSNFWNEGSPTATIFDTTHTVKTLNGASSSSSITTGDMGDDYRFSLLQQARVRYATAPTTATMINYYRNVEGGTLTTDATATMTDGRFDVLRDARWHRLKFSFTGDVESMALNVTATQSGAE